MAALFRVVAVLASGPDQTQGDPAQVMTLHVPLTPDGQLDPQAVADAADYVTVELAEPERLLWSSGLFAAEEGWAVRRGMGEEAPLARLNARSLRPGEYLTLYLEGDREEVFRIVNVEPT